MNSFRAVADWTREKDPHFDIGQRPSLPAFGANARTQRILVSELQG